MNNFGYFTDPRLEQKNDKWLEGMDILGIVNKNLNKAFVQVWLFPYLFRFFIVTLGTIMVFFLYFNFLGIDGPEFIKIFNNIASQSQNGNFTNYTPKTTTELGVVFNNQFNFVLLGLIALILIAIPFISSYIVFRQYLLLDEYENQETSLWSLKKENINQLFIKYLSASFVYYLPIILFFIFFILSWFALFMGVNQNNTSIVGLFVLFIIISFVFLLIQIPVNLLYGSVNMIILFENLNILDSFKKSREMVKSVIWKNLLRWIIIVMVIWLPGYLINQVVSTITSISIVADQSLTVIFTLLVLIFILGSIIEFVQQIFLIGANYLSYKNLDILYKQKLDTKNQNLIES